MEKQRILGFDLARAWAIFGMYIVNFNYVFGNFADASPGGRFLSLFSGNSSSMFVMLAGMGVSLLTWRPDAPPEERHRLRNLLLKRSWFLFFAGMLLYFWWPGDILHFYGAYMHIAVLLMFLPSKWLLWATAGAVFVFHALLLVIPYENGWNFETLHYTDFWTLSGFLRNTFYNGWNPVFPWAAYFFLGMWLGRLDWHSKALKIKVLKWSAALYGTLQAVMWAAKKGFFSEGVEHFLLADYLPPFLPFLAAGAAFSGVLITGCMFLGEKFPNHSALRVLAATGEMTLTHYVSHVTLGLLALAALSGKSGSEAYAESPLPPSVIFAFSAGWFALSVAFSYFWKKRWKRGPLEMLMRSVTG